MHTMTLLSWIPPERLNAISILEPHFLYVCAPMILLVVLCAFRFWAQLMERPIVFAFVYSLPFFLMGFGESWGDSVQWSESIGARYFMSEPGATWIHHWAYRFLHDYCNMGVQASIAFTSRVAGFLFLLIVAVLSRQLLPNATPQQRLVFRCVYFVAGVSLLFFGYVENTPLALPMEQLWILASVIYVKEPSWRRLVWMSCAMAAATLTHGRLSFYAPVFGLACILPNASIATRFKRGLVGGLLYLLLIAAAVIYIQVFDSRYLIGGPWGNITGGGNRQMFTALNDMLRWDHWFGRGMAVFVGGGLLAPVGLLGVAYCVRRIREPLYCWLAAYAAASLCFVSLWEFDYGPAGDWDLVFSAAPPFILIAALLVAPSRIPRVISLLVCAATAVTSLAFGSVVNGRPFEFVVPPTAASVASSQVCKTPGLERTYFADSQLSQALGAPETDLLHREWANDRTPLPTGGRPFGARYRGYVHIPAAGRYRIPIMAQGNVRLVVGDQVLFERWKGLEVRLTIEREIFFPAEGWYPILVEFYTVVQNVPLKVSLESNTTPLHVLTAAELCS